MSERGRCAFTSTVMVAVALAVVIVKEAVVAACSKLLDEPGGTGCSSSVDDGGEVMLKGK